jgi:hypothetical protein
VTARGTLKFLLQPLVDAFTVENMSAFKAFDCLTGLHTIQADAARYFGVRVRLDRCSTSVGGSRVLFFLDFFKSVLRNGINSMSNLFLCGDGTTVLIKLIVIFKQLFFILLAILLDVLNILLHAWQLIMLLTRVELLEEGASLHLLLLELAIGILGVYLNINSLYGIDSMLDVAHEVLIVRLLSPTYLVYLSIAAHHCL